MPTSEQSEMIHFISREIENLIEGALKGYSEGWCEINRAKAVFLAETAEKAYGLNVNYYVVCAANEVNQRHLIFKNPEEGQAYNSTLCDELNAIFAMAAMRKA